MDFRLGADDGQATVEHVGLVAVIAALMIAATAVVAGASPAFRNSIRLAFEHALCVVTGAACNEMAREPCPTLRTVKTTSQGLALSYLRLGHDKVLAIERRSDGTYVMALMEGTQAGGGVMREPGAGAMALSGEASMVLGQRAGRTYEAATPEAARALVERLRRQPFPAVRAVVSGAADLAGLASAEPSVTSYVLAGDGALDALGRFGLGSVLGGGAKYRQRRELGVRIAAHEEEITAYATLDARAGAFFEAMNEIAVPGGRGSRAAPGGGAGSAKAAGGAIDLNKAPPGGAGRRRSPEAESPSNGLAIKNPLARKLEGEAVTGGSVALRFGPGPALLGIEVVGYAGSGTEQKELRVRLDPRDDAVRAAFDRWRHEPSSAPGLAALGRVAADASAIDVRTFRTKSTEHLHGGRGAIGGHAVGLGFGSQSLVSELVEQRSRPGGGEWDERADCVDRVGSHA